MKDNYKISLDVMTDSSADIEVRVFLILELLHAGYISLKKAMELCTEFEIFSNHWTTVDAKTTGLWEKYCKDEHSLFEM